MRQYTIDKRLGDADMKRFCDYLDRNKIPWKDCTLSQQLQGVDILTDQSSYEVKHQTYNGEIVIEESDGLREGWIYTSMASNLILVGKKFTQINMLKLRVFYNQTKKNYKLHHNEQTNGERGDVWAGSYRIYPLSVIEEYVGIKEFV